MDIVDIHTTMEAKEIPQPSYREPYRTNHSSSFPAGNVLKSNLGQNIDRVTHHNDHTVGVLFHDLSNNILDDCGVFLRSWSRVSPGRCAAPAVITIACASV